MLHMQHNQLALLVMERPETPELAFPAAKDAAHREQLERVRDSLLRRPDAPHHEPREA